MSIVFDARKNAEQSKRKRDAVAEASFEPAPSSSAAQVEPPDPDKRVGRAPKTKRQSRTAQHSARSAPSGMPDSSTSKARSERGPLVGSLLRTRPGGPSSITPAGANFSRGRALIEPATLVVRTNPVYPSTAKESLISGRVEVQFRIDPEGKVYDVRSVNGVPILAQAAIEAVQAWCYEPARLNGVPIDSRASTNFDFNLE